ncbi:MAG: hypothetical protein L3J66_02465 [Bacteroidales bacterium]|nr:hypothetical protein [Bacteroidales bacterium]
MKLPDFFKKDIFVFGMATALVLPVVFYAFLMLVDLLVLQLFGTHLTRENHLMYLLATLSNLWPVRYYLVKLKFEKTGLGVLVITAIQILAYFYLFYNQ